jgi:hypothetical protein
MGYYDKDKVEELAEEIREEKMLDRMYSHMANNNIGTVCSALVTLQLEILTKGGMPGDVIIRSFRIWEGIIEALKSELQNPTARNKDVHPPFTDEEVKEALKFKRKKRSIPERAKMN